MSKIDQLRTMTLSGWRDAELRAQKALNDIRAIRRGKIGA